MPSQKPQFYFLLILLVGTFALSFLVFQPFLQALLLALVAGVAAKPIMLLVSRSTGERRGLAAFLTTSLIIIFILIPLGFIGTQIIREASDMYTSLAEDGGQSVVLSITEKVNGSLHSMFPSLPILSVDLGVYAKQGLEWLLQHVGVVFSNAAKIFLGLFIFIVALYFSLKDGEKLKKALIELSPLADNNDEMIFKRLTLAVSSVLKGTLSVAFIQGVVTTIGFFIFGVPHAILWGTITAIAALVPGVGTALVIIPAVMYLFIISSTVAAIGLMLWGVVAVGLIDNILGPALMGRGTKLHPLLVLLSVLGGIGFFGPMGFLFGPLLLSLLFALLDIYSHTTKVQPHIGA